MSSPCKILLGIYLTLCAVSLALVPLSKAGFLGMEPDPLSGIFAVILAMPWTLFTGRWMTETSTLMNILLVGACMLINAAILAGLCRWLRGRKSTTK